MIRRTLLLFFFLIGSIAGPGQAAALNYVAIGDSLAAGQTPKREIGAGYTDMIALAIRPDAYSKALSVPGYTVSQVISQVESEAGKKAIRSADLITISAGANDLLPLIQNDPKRGLLTFNAVTAAFALNGVRENYAVLLEKIKALNPDAKVYAMGYYFPYPHVFDQHKPAVNKQLDILNQIIEQEAEEAGAVFVPVADRFGLDGVQYLPNPGDVHPNGAGYLQMANAFLDIYAPGTKLPVSILEKLPEPVSLADLIKQRQKASERESKARQEEKEATGQTAAVKGCTKEEVYAAML
ncbi:SGNH/GDSL hydrolase family protein [Domibacillus robiginosus]|uniref:SGNH/GDSL hydrolase family protein n=1 Tax=Domibacillus robiginosus TaxID=1071054 RepID=UPI00067AB671|nr:GDSL-type esterase/lipase family protein [Domibacillus robiginosus]